jgi:hypothetical protein
VTVGRGELAFRLEVEQTRAAGVTGGAVIVGRFVAGSIQVGDTIELLRLDVDGQAETVPTTCDGYSMLCVRGWAGVRRKVFS